MDYSTKEKCMSQRTGNCILSCLNSTTTPHLQDTLADGRLRSSLVVTTGGQGYQLTSRSMSRAATHANETRPHATLPLVHYVPMASQLDHGRSRASTSSPNSLSPMTDMGMHTQQLQWLLTDCPNGLTSLHVMTTSLPQMLQNWCMSIS